MWSPLDKSQAFLIIWRAADYSEPGQRKIARKTLRPIYSFVRWSRKMHYNACKIELMKFFVHFSYFSFSWRTKTKKMIPFTFLHNWITKMDRLCTELMTVIKLCRTTIRYLRLDLDLLRWECAISRSVASILSWKSWVRHTLFLGCRQLRAAS